jgi:hypothetical protein
MSEQTDVSAEMPPEITNLLNQVEQDEAKKKAEGEELIPCTWPGCERLIERAQINRHISQAHKRKSASKKRGRPPGALNKPKPLVTNGKTASPMKIFQDAVLIWSDKNGEEALYVDKNNDVWRVQRLK